MNRAGRKKSPDSRPTYVNLTELIRDNVSNARAALDESKIFFGVKMVKMEKDNIIFTKFVPNQIMVLYAGGRFEVLPFGVSGNKVKDYLGIYYNKITHWAPLPIPGHEANPNYGAANTSHTESNRDLYKSYVELP